MHLKKFVLFLPYTLRGAVALKSAEAKDAHAPSPVNETELTLRDDWGGFLDDCEDVRYYLSDADMNKDDEPNTSEPYLESPLLSARCGRLDERTKCSTIRLGDCIVNQAGIMYPADGGGFHGSCSYCRLVDGRTLHCLCYVDYAHSPMVRETELDLNDFIYNFDGNLGCHQHTELNNHCPPDESYDPTRD